MAERSVETAAEWSAAADSGRAGNWLGRLAQSSALRDSMLLLVLAAVWLFFYFATGGTFLTQRNLVLLAVDPERLGTRLLWETSRGGELFPHLYGALDLDHVLSVEALVLQEDGSHRLPEGVAP